MGTNILRGGGGGNISEGSKDIDLGKLHPVQGDKQTMIH